MAEARWYHSMPLFRIMSSRNLLGIAHRADQEVFVPRRIIVVEEQTVISELSKSALCQQRKLADDGTTVAWEMNGSGRTVNGFCSAAR